MIQPGNPQKNRWGLTGVVVAGLVVLVAAIASYQDDDAPNIADQPSEVETQVATMAASSSTPTGSTSTSSATPSATATQTAGYKDGTYSTTASYATPGGVEQMGVSLTLKNGIITDSTVSAVAIDRESRGYQNDFIAAYKGQVVGKSIDAVSLSRVSGASLTSRGFNSALTTIKSQAKS